MKGKQKNVCSICGKPTSVIIKGKEQTEKLCVHCLVTHYPVLKELTGVL